MKSGTGILPVGFCGIGILPMIHGLEAHATLNQLFTHLVRTRARCPRHTRSGRPRHVEGDHQVSLDGTALPDSQPPSCRPRSSQVLVLGDDSLPEIAARFDP
jgi:hypothetical protein